MTGSCTDLVAGLTPFIPSGDSEAERAAEAWSRLGWPDRRVESWRYTRLESIQRADQWTIAAETQRYHVEVTSPEAVEAGGIEILGASDGDESNALRELVGELPIERFGYLNRALSRHTQVVRARAGVVDVHLNGRAAGDVIWGRLILVIPAGGRVSLIDRMASHCTQGRLALPQIQILVSEGAELEHLSLSQPLDSGAVVSETSVWLEKGAKYIGVSASTGSLQRHDLRVKLRRENADASLRQLTVGRNRDHIDYHTSIEHISGDTRSEQVAKALLGETARGVFNGRIYIAPKAQRSDSGLLNKTLLLSRQAEINTKPELEIFADDVKAAHGATIGQLDADSLFYLRSRGIGEDEARRLITSGFALEVGDRLTDVSLRREFDQWTERALRNGQ